MPGRLAAQSCPQVHRRDPSKNPRACGPCGQLSDLTPNTVASLSSPSSIPLIRRMLRLVRVGQFKLSKWAKSQYRNHLSRFIMLSALLGMSKGHDG